MKKMRDERKKIIILIFITRNRYGDMMLMSIEAYERDVALADIYRKLAIAEKQIANGEAIDAETALGKLREKYGY
jgi:hypothetical protein